MGSSSGDGYGSDSEEEGEINQKRLCAKKIIVHNGMRAIWSAIIAAANHLGNENSRSRIYLDGSYYEVPLGIKLIEKLHTLPQITIVKKISEANILLYDLNACVTTDGPIRDYSVEENKILILDGTSSTADCVHKHLKRFVDSRASVLFVVESGLKNQQMGADKNQYGTVRIFTRDHKLRDKFYSDIKKSEPPLLSSTSHSYRREMKAIGAVPVTKFFIIPHPQPILAPAEQVLPERHISSVPSKSGLRSRY